MRTTTPVAAVPPSVGVPVPGPSRLASLSWMRRLGTDVLGTMDDLAARYGDVSRLRVARQSVVFVRGHDAAKRVLVANQDNYRKSRQFDLFRPILGDGLVTSSGETWSRSRRMVNPLFARRHLGVYADHMAAAAEVAVGRWDELPDGRDVDLDGEMLRVGLDTVFRALVSQDIDRVGDELGGLIAGSLHQIGGMSRTPAAFLLQDIAHVGIVRAARLTTPRRWRHYTSLATQADDVVSALVDDRITLGSGARHDLLTLLLESADPTTGERLSRRQVIDELATFIAAGHETTAHGLAWMFWLLGHHPAAQERVEEEVDSVLAGGGLPTAEDADRLPYLKACFQEAMRLYPPVWHIPRLAVDDDVLAGHRVPAGSRIMVNVWSTHRDPAVYPDPGDFVPERWLDADAQPPRFAYLPFGGGRRACVGQSFAMLNAMVLGAAVAARYRFSTSASTPIRLEPTITLRPFGGIPATAHRRVLP